MCRLGFRHLVLFLGLGDWAGCSFSREKGAGSDFVGGNKPKHVRIFPKCLCEGVYFNFHNLKRLLPKNFWWKPFQIRSFCYTNGRFQTSTVKSKLCFLQTLSSWVSMWFLVNVGHNWNQSRFMIENVRCISTFVPKFLAEGFQECQVLLARICQKMRQNCRAITILKSPEIKQIRQKQKCVESIWHCKMCARKCAR